MSIGRFIFILFLVAVALTTISSNEILDNEEDEDAGQELTDVGIIDERAENGVKNITRKNGLFDILGGILGKRMVNAIEQGYEWGKESEAPKEGSGARDAPSEDSGANDVGIIDERAESGVRNTTKKKEFLGELVKTLLGGKRMVNAIEQGYEWGKESE